MKPKQKNPVRSTRSWSWSGEGIVDKDGTVRAWSSACDARMAIGATGRKTRTVRVLVKVTEVRK